MAKTNREQDQKQDFKETIIQIKRVSKKTKGGNRMGFTSLAIVGDEAGQVGTALSRAPSVIEAIRKSTRRAKKELVDIPLVGEAKTIPHEIEFKNGASHILLKPAPAGTGIRAGGSVRAVLEAAGIQNIVAKILGSKSKKSNVDTTIMALQKLKSPDKRIVGKK